MAENGVRVRDMPGPDLRRMLRAMSPEIARLAKRGDAFAKAFIRLYRYAFDHPKDIRAELDLRAAFEDYILRDLNSAARLELGGKFNHLQDEVTGPKLYFVPDTVVH